MTDLPRGGSTLSFLLSIFASLLPPWYRRRLPVFAGMDLRNGALVSGIIEGAGCLLIFIIRYLGFIQARVGELGGKVIAKGADEALAGVGAQAGMGFVTTMEYLIYPSTLVLIYFTLEGGVRVVAALSTEETLGSLPLHLVAWADERIVDWRMERALGPRVADIVEAVYSPDYDLRVFTCRPKPNWDRMVTVAHEGQLYEVLDQQEGKPPRRFVYRLRKSKPGRVVRAVHEYRPEEVLWKEEAPSLPARILTALGLLRAQRRAAKALPPPLPDSVERIPGVGCELRIASCRAKPGWDHLMTVEYEDVYYEIVREEPGPAAHPYVYLLRKLPQGKAIRALHHYHPEETLSEGKDQRE